MNEEADRLHKLVSEAIDDNMVNGFSLSVDPKPFTADVFHRAIKAVSEQRYRPPMRLYSPGQYRLLDEDAKAFGIDQSDPQWDILVQHEWAAYHSFTRYLARMGWREDQPLSKILV